MLKTFLKKYKNDLILIGVICLCAGLIAGGSLFFRRPGAYVRIEMDGETVKVLPLDIEWTEFFYSANNGVNEVRIADGKVSCVNASCPDKLCVHMGEVFRVGDTVVCLPNRFVITVISEEEAKR
ncbi:MAG: NusG domain II-containing protein [Lachnospiraceae bacterium]|nr:NusG domain II-containing protein [Lachnospiraceae bacterium]